MGGLSPPPGFALEAGKCWTERHGAEYDFDEITWTITDYVPGSCTDFQGMPSGSLQRVQMSIGPVDDGYLLVEDIRFSSTVAGKIGTSVVV